MEASSLAGVQKAEGRCLSGWGEEVPTSTQNLLVSEASQKIALYLLCPLLIIEVTNSVLLIKVTCLSKYSLSLFGLLIYLCKSYISFYTPVRFRGNNKDIPIQGDIILVLRSYVTWWVGYIPGMQKQGLKISQSEKNPLDWNKKWTLPLIMLSELNTVLFR